MKHRAPTVKVGTDVLFRTEQCRHGQTHEDDDDDAMKRMGEWRYL
jgi:hypothetical protein